MDGGAVEFKNLRAGLDRSSERRYPFLIDRTRLKIDGLVGLIFQDDLIMEQTARFNCLWDDHICRQRLNSARSRRWWRHGHKSRNDTVAAQLETQI